MRPHPWSRRLAPAVLLLLAASPLFAADPLYARIDRLIATGYPNYAVEAARLASDAEFLRRVHLDLTGRIPTAADARSFLADRSSDKRARVIDTLLSSPHYARRMQEHFDVVLMDRRKDAKVPRAKWEEYLYTSFAANKPYDRLVRELLTTDGADEATRPAAKFLLDRDLDPTTVTRDISRLFLGRNLQCAQCHDHPLVDDYKQEHFFGIQAFFHRASLFPDAKSDRAVIAEKADGEVSFVSVFDPKKTQKTTPPKLLAWAAVADAKVEKGKEYKVAPAKNVKPVPAYSRLAQLGPAITGSDNPAFARTATNRLWALMLGRGLIHPLDLDHTGNPPSHPELLDLLAAEFAAHKFDVKYLLREIALSQTYQRSSELPAGRSELPEDRYHVAVLKPLSPEQFAYSAMQATGYTDSVRASLAKNATEPALHAKLAPTAAPFLKTFGTRPGEPEEGFAATLDQTLFVKHGSALRTLIDPRPGSLLDRLGKQTDGAAIADELFLSVLTRLPTAEERADVSAATATADRKTALADVTWALLASAEFRFNH